MQAPENDRKALKVKTELCLGCGACAQACADHAIWFLWGRAMINQARCKGCGTCRKACPQSAIEEEASVG